MTGLAQHPSRSDAVIVCWHIVITGVVQGIGFRPFVFRLANELGVKGHVANNGGQVTIIAAADRQTLETFCQRLISNAPANARPVVHLVGTALLSETGTDDDEDFSIRQSSDLGQCDMHIVPDLPTCDQCLAELFDRNNRRYLYPFINCSQCGPRYSIIESLPYDRANTSMRGFELCRDCALEYRTASNRRFHAEPIACKTCGPVLNFVDDTRHITDNTLALEACIAALKQGRIIAVKGVGGYHLMCDATSAVAVASLRRRKQRPDKPFAILMDQAWLDGYVDVGEQELLLLQQGSRPIVMIKRSPSCPLPDNLAPGLNQLGVMLPSHPLQHLLCHGFNKPLVATSANISGEPIVTHQADASERLRQLCDAFLHHNRPIVRPADDPVIRQNNARTQLLRSGRGLAPTEFTLSFTLKKPLLAVGGHIKNTIALAWHNRMVISAHNGDLDTLRSYQTFQQAISDLQQLYQVKARHIVCDAHPAYASSRWADEAGLAVSRIYHHHAHASGLALDFPQQKHHWLVFAWDGVGLGDDGTLWGGETFLGGPGHWQRVASFKPFRLPGGDKTARQPWRVAASLCWHSDIDVDISSDPVRQLKIIWDTGTNCPQSSAAGRLFCAAAALLGLVGHESYEGHGPMLLQALAETAQADALALPINRDDKGIARIDWQPLVMMLKDKTFSTAYRARCFHETLAQCIGTICLSYSAQYKDLAVGLSGGVFQNQLLVHLIRQRLHKHKLDVNVPTSIPVNDGGLCAGQIIEYHYQ